MYQDTVCLRLHPKRCQRFCRNGPNHKHGCSKGADCSKFHPALCSTSVSSKSCFVEACTSIHLKGTKRKQGGPPNQRRPLNSNRSSKKSNRRAPPPPTAVSRPNNISRNPPLPPHPTLSAPHPTELSFLAGTVHGMLKEISLLKQDMLISRHAPSGPPTHAPPRHHPSAPPHQRLPTSPSADVSSFICLNIQGMTPGAYSKSRWKVPRLTNSLLTEPGLYIPFIALTETWLKPFTTDAQMTDQHSSVQCLQS